MYYITFFLGKESKFVWFYMPIMLLLILNTVMFTLTVKSVCLLDKQKRDLGLTSGQRSMEMERSVLPICHQLFMKDRVHI